MYLFIFDIFSKTIFKYLTKKEIFFSLNPPPPNTLGNCQQTGVLSVLGEFDFGKPIPVN